MIHIVGVDPGIVHTGVVRMRFSELQQKIEVTHFVLMGADGKLVKSWVNNAEELPTRIFVEDYRNRGNVYKTDTKMRDAVADIKHALPKAIVLDNTGSKQVVSKDLMELLGVWKFSTKTHHQDLRSAARIALFGMLKDNDLNRLLSDIVLAHLSGTPWEVQS